jgi:hypothetical protein
LVSGNPTEGIEYLEVDLQDPVRYLVFAGAEQCTELHDVCADDKYGLATCNNDTVERRISRDCRGRLLEFVDRQRIELVDRVILKVKTEFGDSIVNRLYSYRLSRVNHFNPLQFPIRPA